MKYDFNGNCYIAESFLDFNGWDILGKRRYKDGVYIVDVRRDYGGHAEFRSVICKEDQLPECLIQE